MEDCIFCKIIKGEIPANKVYEDDEVLAFLDIAPVNPGHTIVIPKKHFKTLIDTPDDELANLTKKVKRIAKGVMEGVKSEGFNLSVNNGEIAGQEVPHIHFHIMPRFSDDGHTFWTKIKYKEDEADTLAKKIKEAI